MKKILLAAGAAVLLAGCSTAYKVQKAETLPESVGIVVNPKVRVPYALTSIQRGLEKHGVRTIICSNETLCTGTTHLLKYQVFATWDFKMYLKKADLWLYEDGRQVASATLKTGPWDWSKWSDNEGKLEGLVDDLLGKSTP